MKFIIATNNKKKLRELAVILEKLGVSAVSLAEAGVESDVEETGTTFEENSRLKAMAAMEKSGLPAIADDSGLEVDALGGEPGVYSARYAGENNDSEANMRKLLQNLTGKSERSAQFRTVIALIIEGEEFLFDGIVRGRISEERMGSAGFGYDPIFVPDGHEESFAQMAAEQKNAISHRSRAASALNDYLETL